MSEMLPGQKPVTDYHKRNPVQRKGHRMEEIPVNKPIQTRPSMVNINIVLTVTEDETVLVLRRQLTDLLSNYPSAQMRMLMQDVPAMPGRLTPDM